MADTVIFLPEAEVNPLRMFDVLSLIESSVAMSVSSQTDAKTFFALSRASVETEMLLPEAEVKPEIGTTLVLPSQKSFLEWSRSFSVNLAFAAARED